MPSHLTRHVFRRILANEPIIHRACLRRQASSTTRRPANLARRPIHRNGSHRRTFFNFNMFKGKKADAKEADIDPGIEDIMQLAKLQRMRARLPPAEDIASAFREFFEYKYTKKEAISDTQAELILGAWKYCFDPQQPRSNDETALSIKHLAWKEGGSEALHAVLYRSASSPTAAHVELVETVLAALDGGSVSRHLRRVYVKMLSTSGRALDARNFTLRCEEQDFASGTATSTHGHQCDLDSDAVSRFSKSLGRLWPWVLRGFASEDNEAELLKTLDMIRAREWTNQNSPFLSESMLKFYLRQDDVSPVKLWFTTLWRCYEPVSSSPGTIGERMGTELQRVLRWCIEHNELEFGHEAVRQSMSGEPPKEVWDAIFIWAAGTGKGADEIGRMFNVMEKTNDARSNPDEWRLPDITTINNLVEYATSKADPYLAERFIALGKDRNIEPDARTFQLQMDYRLNINDVDGALIAYKSLQAMDTSSNEDLPVVNKLIVAMCKGKRHDFDTIMNVAMDLSDRRARFEPETVSTLALLHLNRDEVHDVVDLLNTHAYHYSSSERASIRDAILAFCIDPETPLSRSWDAYTVIRVIFEETPRPQRTEIMKNFFERGRPDMAVSLFNEMRKHSRVDTMPTVETYAAAFMGSARLQHLDSLEVIHNQLKLDYNVDLNTYVNNALMLAYTACGQPRKAIGFWDNIVSSKEGPTFNSIHIALRACEMAPFGDLRAKELWEKLRKKNIDLGQSLWASYAAALVGNGDNELGIKTLEAAEARNDLVVDAFLLGSMYDGAQNGSKQDEIEEWAKEKYPGVWEELEKIGSEVNEQNGKRRFELDRTVTP